MSLNDKIESVRGLLAGYGSVLVGLSGGVDSSVLLKLSVDTLGPDRVLAVTARSEISTPGELDLAARVAILCGVEHMMVESSDLRVPGFSSNPPDRCYHCKHHRFSLLRQLAVNRGLNAVLDGSNQSDLGDYRPGMRALHELGIKSPLLECGLTKEELRQLARASGLPNWNKPSNACLASRFPYGTPITAADLTRVARGEEMLRALGLVQFRLRHYGETARIEADPEQFALVTSPEQRTWLVNGLKNLGYTFVTLDLEGFRSGSLNKAIAPLSPDRPPSP
ncbi:MAG: ATP-dependent sacrificial sulfur transferase LarE [Firmicutes bacterium]|nr:ATP-dependent sacrificial sulfur transferase LarE [Bacillota bacterium]